MKLCSKWPKHSAIRIVGIVIGAVLSGGSLAGATVELRLTPAERNILEEYRTRLRDLKQQYGNMSMQGIRRETLFRASKGAEDPTRERASSLVFYAREGRMFRAESRASGPEGHEAPGPAKLLIVRPEGYLAARNDGLNGAWVVSGWGPSEEGLANLSHQAFLWSPCNVYVTPVETWIFGPLSFKPDSYCIDHVTEEADQSGRLVHVHAKASWKNGMERRYLFTFYRDKWWALKEIALGIQDPMGQQDEVLRGTYYYYDGTVDAPPLLKRVEYWREVGPARTRAMVESFEVVKIDLHPPPKGDFDAESLGVRIGTPRSVWVLRSVILLTGIALVALYVLLRRSERKPAGTVAERPSAPGG